MDYELEELIDTYGKKLLHYATSILSNHQDAEDIVQDVFITAYRNMARFDGQNLSAWLYKITYNQCINKLKRRKFFILRNIPENTIAPEKTTISGETLYALSQLKPKDRALLYARVMEGYSYEELSKQMNQSPATLRKRYERVKKKLADHLGIEKN